MLTILFTIQYGNGTLRLTTRQTYQLHGVLKQDLKTVFSSVIKNMGSTLAACGDVNRNVMSPPAPYKNRPEYEYATQYANDIADLLAPQSGAYYDVWLDGEKFFSHEMEVKPLSAFGYHCFWSCAMQLAVLAETVFAMCCCAASWHDCYVPLCEGSTKAVAC